MTRDPAEHRSADETGQRLVEVGRIGNLRQDEMDRIGCQGIPPESQGGLILIDHVASIVKRQVAEEMHALKQEKGHESSESMELHHVNYWTRNLRVVR